MRSYLLRPFWLLGYLLGVVLCAALPLAAQETPAVNILPADVRMVVDVSGSMKKNDPQNLRKPAMELMIKLLPQESRAGVWSFGESVNLLVPHKLVNNAWREEATAKTDAINSAALFTHIGAALEQAAYDIGKQDKTFRNNIILLTDGMVDIEQSAEVNARERERIRTELLPRLQAAGYVIHTIALSDDADKALMEELSMATDGVFATVKDAEQLMSAFLRIFDQAVPLERLPLEQNRFLVDPSVEEFTALIFRKPQARPTELVAPDGNIYTAANALGKVKWHSTANYDLITVTRPLAGEWQVNAEVNPDSRVTVVSNLQLMISPLKNNMEVSQTMDLNFSLQEDESTVVDPQFLQLLDLDVVVTRRRDGKQWQLPLVNTIPPIDGVYQHPLELFRETGNYTVQLLIDGKTFKREFKHQVTVGSPFNVTMERVLHQNRVTYQLLVSADDERVDISKTAIVAQVKDSTGGSAMRNFDLNEQGVWQLMVSPNVSARYSVGLQVSGLRTDGQPVKEVLATQYFTFPDEDDPVPLPIDEYVSEEVPIEETPETSAEEPATDDAASEDPAVVMVAEPPSDTDSPAGKKWLMYISVAVANLLVLGLAFFAFRMIMGKKAKEEIDEVEETLNTDVQKMVDVKKAPPAMQDFADITADKSIDLAADSAAATGLKSSAVAGSVTKNAPEAELDDFDDFLADTDFPLDSPDAKNSEDDGDKKS